VSKNILKSTATGLVAGAVLGWLLSLVSGKLVRHTRCGNARTFRRGSSWNCLSKWCLRVRQLSKKSRLHS